MGNAASEREIMAARSRCPQTPQRPDFPPGFGPGFAPMEITFQVVISSTDPAHLRRVDSVGFIPCLSRLRRGTCKT
jgi:hypothetical protein